MEDLQELPFTGCCKHELDEGLAGIANNLVLQVALITGGRCTPTISTGARATGSDCCCRCRGTHTIPCANGVRFLQRGEVASHLKPQ
eukprot:13907370-Alexandrium_andersonii.AAC.1